MKIWGQMNNIPFLFALVTALLGPNCAHGWLDQWIKWLRRARCRKRMSHVPGDFFQTKVFQNTTSGSLRDVCRSLVPTSGLLTETRRGHHAAGLDFVRCCFRRTRNSAWHRLGTYSQARSEGGLYLFHIWVDAGGTHMLLLCRSRASNSNKNLGSTTETMD